MHIVHVFETFLPKEGGWVAPFFYALEGQGVGVSVVCRRTSGEHAFQPVIAGDVRRWKRVLSWRRVDVAHVHGFDLLTEGRDLAKALNIPLIVSANHVPTPHPNLDGVDLALAVFAHDKDRIGLAEERKQLWRPGIVDVEEKTPDADIMYIGNRHTETILQATALLPDSINVHLAHRTRALEQQAIELGIAGNVQFAPSHSRVLIADAESLPLNALQAVGHGSIPIFLGAQPFPSPFSHKQNTLFVDPSAPAIAQALESVLSDEQRQAGLRKHAQTTAQAFDRAASAEHLKAIYEHIK